MLALCLHIAARGQTIASLDDIDLSALPKATKAKALRYWYDDDGGSVRTVTQLKGQQTLDVSALMEGLHTLHYQVIDENNDVADVQSALFMKMNGGIVGTTAKQLRYWFDDDTSTLKTITATGGTQTLDASKLLDGLHTVHYQVIGSDNAAYHIVSALFMKMGGGTETVTAKKLMYWFDDETTITTVDVGQGVQMLDASRLMDGLHTIHYQVRCSNGMLTPAQSSLFMRMNFDTESTVAKQLRYWFDDGQMATTASITAGSTMLDASQLIDGLHTVHYQIVDSKGGLGSPASSVFMKMDAAASTQAKKLRYWFDDDAATVRVVDVAQGTQTLDVSGLLTGLHTLCYQLVDSEGKVSTPYTRLFMKAFDKVVPDGQNRVTKYQYWLNKNSQAMQTVTLPNAANPYQLISLLPMQKEPIHSDCFHFEMTNGQPTIYAKNIFHIRFHDAGGYFADDSKQFVDYDVKQEVTDFIQLEHGVPSTTCKPVNNAIKWYKVEALRGDSLAFRTLQACTLHLFSPSGKELYSASSPDVLKFDGSYAPEDGIYYIAIHDVMSQYDNNITVEFQHIDRYTILDYTPTKFSCEGVTILSVNGTGMDCVESIELVNSEITLLPDTIIGNRTNMVVRFSLNYPLGEATKFDLNITFFAEGDNDNTTVNLRNAITLEPANKGDIAVSVTSERRVGDPYPITVTLKNKGNVGYYGIPLDIAFDNPAMIDDFKFVNFDVSVTDSLFIEGGLFAFTDNLLGMQKEGIFAPLLVPYLGPNEEAVFVFGVKTKIAHAKFNFYAWVGEPWYDGTSSSEEESRHNAPRKAPCKISNIPEAARDLNERTQTGRRIVGLATRNAGIAAGNGVAISGLEVGLTRHNASELQKAYNLPPEMVEQNRFHYYGEQYLEGRNPWRILNHPFDFLRPPESAQSRQRRTSGSSGNSASSYASSDCPLPNPNPTDVYIPGDPNEITGYVAESGSHYMMDGIKTVGYDIEFENDPKLANSAAHSIIIETQLDPLVFDLSSFTPKDITISNKKVELSGEQSFVTTLDLRTAINVIAELKCDYNSKTGKIKWTMSSLDPMSMEPTDDIMQGLLPINNSNGVGIGHVSYSVDLLDGLVHGTPINNKASIIFDSNDAIETPTWTNTIDRVKPTSRVVDANLLPSGETAAISISASDDGSGPWRYNVYVQYGSGAWFLAAENVPADTTAAVKIYDGIEHHFYCVATDMAGNVEEKDARSEFTFTVSEHVHGDANSDGKVDVADIAYIIDVMAKGEYSLHADANGDGAVNVADIAEVIDIMAANARRLEMERLQHVFR